MAVTNRSPWLMDIVTLATGGVFVFAWLILMMNDLNRVEPRPKFNTRIIGSALCISYSLAVFSIIWLMFTHDSFSVPTLPTLAAFFFGFISCLTSPILLVFYLAYVSVHIQKTLDARLIRSEKRREGK